MSGHWLMKSEPSVYSIDDLKRDRVTSWEGVRNYQVRNMMRDQMQKGDLAFFYHSNANPPGIAGICRVIKTAYPDPHAWNPKSHYYDPKSTPENPVWVMVDVEFVEKFSHFVSLEELRNNKELSDLLILRPGSRLSIVPVPEKLFDIIRKMGKTH
jgi:predicted RNA-binding protein with PUA-like domain